MFPTFILHSLACCIDNLPHTCQNITYAYIKCAALLRRCCRSYRFSRLFPDACSVHASTFDGLAEEMNFTLLISLENSYLFRIRMIESVEISVFSCICWRVLFEDCRFNVTIILFNIKENALVMRIEINSEAQSPELKRSASIWKLKTMEQTMMNRWNNLQTKKAISL